MSFTYTQLQTAIQDFTENTRDILCNEPAGISFAAQKTVFLRLLILSYFARTLPRSLAVGIHILVFRRLSRPVFFANNHS